MLFQDFLVCYTTVMMVSPVFSQNEPQCTSRFDYEYKVVQKLVDLENSKREQDKMIEELMKKNSILETEIESIRNVSKETIVTLTSEFKETNKEIKAALEVARDAIDSLTTRVENLSSSFKGSAPRPFYGFSAYESASRSASVGSTIVLRRTRLNEGAAYITDTGQFMAPVDGIYIFHATLCTTTGGNYIYAAFLAGEEVIGRLAANDKDWDTCQSGSAVARLQKGINVYLKVTYVISGTVLRDDSNHLNSFSGFLVGM